MTDKKPDAASNDKGKTKDKKPRKPPSLTTKTRKVTRHLACHLRDEEILKASKELTHEMSLKQTEERNQKEVVAQFKAKIARHDAAIEHLRKTIEMGQEYRQVQCKEITDFKTARVKVTRLDSKEVIEDRAMMPAEAQSELPI